MIERIELRKREIEFTEKDNLLTFMCLDLGKYVDWGTLIGINTHEDKAFLISKTGIKHRPSFVRSKRFSDSSSRLSEIISELSFKDTGFIKELDFLSLNFSDYSKFDNISAMTDRENELFRIFLEKFDGCPKKIEIPEPTIAANELKARGLENGYELILTKDDRSFESRIYIEFSCFLSGSFVSSRRDGRTSGLLLGLGGEIIEAISRAGRNGGSKDLLVNDCSEDAEVYEEVISESAGDIMEQVEIGRVRAGQKEIGNIPVNISKSYRDDVPLLGLDEHVKNKSIAKINEIGKRAASFGNATIKFLSQLVYLRLIGSIIQRLHEEGWIQGRTGVFLSGVYHPPKADYNLPDYLNDLGFGNLSGRISYIENPYPFGLMRMAKNIPNINSIDY
ncbi:MAG: DUF2114 family protein [Candidatus Hadarchaeia archaeon]